MTTKPLPISIFIIAFNEADRLPATLLALKGLAEEIIVVDSGSTDSTVAIADAFGATVFHHDWQGYGLQKRFGEDQCRHHWVLNIDADEIMTSSLTAEIRALFAHGLPSASFYRMRIDTIYPGDIKPRPFANDLNFIRLYDKTVGRFSAHATDDIVIPPAGARVVQLKQRMHHHSMRSFAHMRQKLLGYFRAQAQVLQLPSIPVLVFRTLVDFPLWFFKYYFLKRHITGGYKGFLMAFWYAYCRTYRSSLFLMHALHRRFPRFV